jgi:hypothetical protein
MIVRKSRPEVSTSWSTKSREKEMTKSRNYMLGSFFSTVLTAIIDPKDDKAIRIKTDPAYLADSEYVGRKEATTTWRSRFRS